MGHPVGRRERSDLQRSSFPSSVRVRVRLLSGDARVISCVYLDSRVEVPAVMHGGVFFHQGASIKNVRTEEGLKLIQLMNFSILL